MKIDINTRKHCSELLVTYIFSTTVKECQRVHPILYYGTYDGYPMENYWRMTLVARQELKDDRSNTFTDELSGAPYKLAEHVKNDDHNGKRRESSEEFDIADICETREGEVLKGENRCQVCHWEEVEDG